MAGWKLRNFDHLTERLPPRDHAQFEAWLDQLAADPYAAGEPFDHAPKWRAVGLRVARCGYEICDKTRTVTCTGFSAGADAWQAEDG